VRAILDANRNSLMLLELRFSIFTLGLGAGTFVAALYGMNLKNFIEESNLGFWGVSGISAALSVVVLMYGLARLRKVQRVSIWGEYPLDAAARKNGWKHSGHDWMRLRDLKNEDKGCWGVGQSSPTVGLGALGGPAEIRADRLKKAQEIRLQQQSWQRNWQQHAHAAVKRRKAEAKKTSGPTRPETGYGSTMSGLGAKPGDGSPALD